MARIRGTAAGDWSRDTDADWRRLASSQPYWAVLSQPDFKRDKLTPETLDAFYASGRSDIAGLIDKLNALQAAPVKIRTALDFGCGVGRLTEAMTDYADQVTGYDVAPDMIKIARSRQSKALYTDALPEGPFDWINSFIVFQHIPPPRGLELLANLLERVAPGGLISLHFTIWRDESLRPSSPRSVIKRLISWLWAPAGAISMYDYDFNDILKLLERHGLQRLVLDSINHGGHHGVMILGRREAASPSSKS